MATYLLLTATAANQQFGRFGETGMAFQIARARLPHWRALGLVLVLSDGRILPYQNFEEDYATVSDWLSRDIDTAGEAQFLNNLETQSVFSDRAAALAALSRVELPPGYLPTPGAIPLIGIMTATSSFTMYRYCWTAFDPAFDGKTLSPGAYLTSNLDHLLANTGFGAVGRYALPIPAPATHVFQYQLPVGTVMRVGTVSPMFGQAGGGVEARLDSVPPNTVVVQTGHLQIAPF